LRVFTPPLVSHLHFRASACRVFETHADRTFYLFCIFWVWDFFPYGEGGFFHYFIYSIVELCVCRLLRYVHREESCYSLAYSLLKARLGCAFALFYFYVTLDTSFDHLGWCSPSFYRGRDDSLIADIPASRILAGTLMYCLSVSPICVGITLFSTSDL